MLGAELRARTFCHKSDLLFDSFYLNSLPSGVDWYLGTSCGQCAPEPRQLDGVHSNQMHTA